jgi:hypothetical protein
MDLQKTMRRRRHRLRRTLFRSVSGFTIAFALVLLLPSCQKSRVDLLDRSQAAVVEDSVLAMAANVARDIGKEGPRAWLSYFARSPQFFMATEGKLDFPNIDSALILPHRFDTLNG